MPPWLTRWVVFHVAVVAVPMLAAAWGSASSGGWGWIATAGFLGFAAVSTFGTLVNASTRYTYIRAAAALDEQLREAEGEMVLWRQLRESLQEARE